MDDSFDDVIPVLESVPVVESQPVTSNSVCTTIAEDYTDAKKVTNELQNVHISPPPKSNSNDVQDASSISTLGATRKSDVERLIHGISNLDLMDSYNFNHKRRGTAVIINQRDFDYNTSMSTRSGTDVDKYSLIETFRQLRFRVEVHQNLRTCEMMKTLARAAQENHTDSDCFVCAIMSHGEEGEIYGRDGKIPIDELIAPFKGDKCPTLVGKPKLFFLQACRGSKLDSGAEFTDADIVTDSDEVDAKPICHRIPTEADFMMAYAVVPGYRSLRDSDRGSYFIQALCEVFNKHAHEFDIMKLMTCVNRKVAYDFESNTAKEFMNKKKQIPCIVSMLTKDLYFTQKSQ